jgi:hypothetical protein
MHEAVITAIASGTDSDSEWENRYTGAADGAVSALVELGLRAAQEGDDAHADAQVFALPADARAEYRFLLQQVRARRTARLP